MPAPDPSPVPVHIVAGFLGAGKTSLIRDQLAARPQEKLAVLVNDFGEAGLDEASLAEGAPFQITQIPGGCVCCTAPEGFVAALGALLEQHPDRLLIEPTGLARPQDLVDTIRRSHHREALALRPVVVLVDPRRLAHPSAAEGPLLEQQLGVADVLVANHTDLCSPDDLQRFDARAEGLWPAPLAVYRTQHGRIPATLLEWPADEGDRLPRGARATRTHSHASPAESSAAFRALSFQWPAEQIFERERLARAALRASQGLAGSPLARFKGVFHTREGFLQLEVAGGTVHEQASAYRRESRADVIFESPDDAPFTPFSSWLEAAQLRGAEREYQTRQIELALPDGRVRILDRQQLAKLPGGIPDISQHFPKRSGSAARVASLWRALDLEEEGRAVICAADGFASDPLPVSALCQGMLLHSLGDAPLPAAQGGPFRLLIPPEVEAAPPGCANVKAVVRIVVRA